MGSDRLVSRDVDGLAVGDVLKQHGLVASDASLKKLAFASSQVCFLRLSMPADVCLVLCSGACGQTALCSSTAMTYEPGLGSIHEDCLHAQHKVAVYM